MAVISLISIILPPSPISLAIAAFDDLIIGGQDMMQFVMQPGMVYQYPLWWVALLLVGLVGSRCSAL